MECENNGCIIGLIYDYEDTRIVRLDDLIGHIQRKVNYNRWVEADKYLRDKKLKIKVYSLEDYADVRKTTDFRRFKYCPDCGKKIDWTEIKKRG